MPSNPELTAVVVVGKNRRRAQVGLDALYAQSIVDRLEIVVVDLASIQVPPLETAPHAWTKYERLGPGASWAHGRAVAVSVATTPFVAFVEDHATADSRWAEALARAFRDGWAAIGYAFTNPHGEYYVARGILASEYGAWAHPTRSRQARVLPSGNVAYRRDVLLALGADLERMLTPDFALHEHINRQGLKMFVEGSAIVAHDSLGTLSSLASASFLFCRLLGARRAETQRWSAGKRLAYSLATPVVSPAIAFGRLLMSPGQTVAGRAALIKYVPILSLKFLSSSVGEAVGYLMGSGSSTEEKFGEWELHVDRSPRSQ